MAKQKKHHTKKREDLFPPWIGKTLNLGRGEGEKRRRRQLILMEILMVKRGIILW
jgi:hypothetical protein